MEILTYFEDGPGTNTIKQMVSDIVLSSAKNIGVNSKNLKNIAIAYPENYGKAIREIAGGSFTNNNDYIGIGKTITKLSHQTFNHSIIFNACIFEAILKGHAESGSCNVEDWNVEHQCMYFAIPHELGHCKDHEKRKIESSTNALTLTSGFNLEIVHNYYIDILVSESCACHITDKYYSSKMINHRFCEEAKTLNQSYTKLKNSLNTHTENDLFNSALNASSWIWLYQIQLAKHLISSNYITAKPSQLMSITDAFKNCDEEHNFFHETLVLLLKDYPHVDNQINEQLINAWEMFAKKAGFSFEGHNNDWSFYWK